MVCFSTSLLMNIADIRVQDSTPSTDEFGGFSPTAQDPITGEIIRDWVDDDPQTFDVDGIKDMPCDVKLAFPLSRLDADSMDERYQYNQYIKISYPETYAVKVGDVITNIRHYLTQQVLWQEQGKPVRYEIQSVAPIIDGYSGNILNMQALAKRAQVQ